MIGGDSRAGHAFAADAKHAEAGERLAAQMAPRKIQVHVEVPGGGGAAANNAGFEELSVERAQAKLKQSTGAMSAVNSKHVGGMPNPFLNGWGVINMQFGFRCVQDPHRLGKPNLFARLV